MNELATIYLSAVLLGGVVEVLAWALKLWVFSVPGFVLLQILFVEGLAMGTLAWTIIDQTPRTQYITSAAAGGLIEILNAAWFDLWDFPGSSFIFIKGRVIIVLAMTLAWGFYCPLVIMMGKRLLLWREKTQGKPSSSS